MKSLAAAILVVLAAALESTVIVVALLGGVTGVVALGYAFHRTEVLRHSIDRQRHELNRVKSRVSALEPPHHVG